MSKTLTITVTALHAQNATFCFVVMVDFFSILPAFVSSDITILLKVNRVIKLVYSDTLLFYRVIFTIFVTMCYQLAEFVNQNTSIFFFN